MGSCFFLCRSDHIGSFQTYANRFIRGFIERMQMSVNRATYARKCHITQLRPREFNDDIKARIPFYDESDVSFALQICGIYDKTWQVYLRATLNFSRIAYISTHIYRIYAGNWSADSLNRYYCHINCILFYIQTFEWARV